LAAPAACRGPPPGHASIINAATTDHLAMLFRGDVRGRSARRAQTAHLRNRVAALQPPSFSASTIYEGRHCELWGGGGGTIWQQNGQSDAVIDPRKIARRARASSNIHNGGCAPGLGAMRGAWRFLGSFRAFPHRLTRLAAGERVIIDAVQWRGAIIARRKADGAGRWTCFKSKMTEATQRRAECSADEQLCASADRQICWAPAEHNQAAPRQGPQKWLEKELDRLEEICCC